MTAVEHVAPVGLCLAYVAALVTVLPTLALVVLVAAGRRPRGVVNRALVVSGVPDVEDGER